MRKPFTLRRVEAKQARYIPLNTEGLDRTGRDESTPLYVDQILDTEEGQIARINELTRAGRGNWFGLLAYLAFTVVTVLAVQDADFFTGRPTDLPLIGVSIPTQAFFYAAPILGAALHVYLHLIIRKSTEALCVPSPFVRKTRNNPPGVPLENPVLPWLLNDLVLRGRADGAATRRPLDWLAGLTAVALIWAAAPFVLSLMWFTSLPAHDERMSLVIVICLGASIYASLQTAVKLVGDWRALSHDRPSQLNGKPASAVVFTLALMVWLGLSGATILFTEGGIDRLTSVDDRPDWARWRWTEPIIATLARRPLPDWARDNSLLAPANLRDVVFAELPPDQVDPSTARTKYRAEWCKRVGHPPVVCGTARADLAEVPPFRLAARRDWCKEQDKDISNDECQAYFDRTRSEFNHEWQDYRTAYLKSLEKPVLSERDLRNAVLTGAQLSGVDIGEAQLEGSNLVRAQLEGANLGAAQMEGTDLSTATMVGADFLEAQLEGANLSTAWLERADLSGASMVGTDFRGSQMKQADLRFAKMEGVNLREAQMEGTSLGEAQVQGVDLGGANLEGADLSGAQLEGANLKVTNLRSVSWTAAQATASLVQSTDMRGGDGLPQGRLWSLIGNAATLLPVPLQGEEPRYVCSCWQSDPPGIESMFGLAARFYPSEEEVRSEELGLFCASGEAPMKTGTPWPLDEDPPWEQAGLDVEDWIAQPAQQPTEPCPPEPWAE